jgi:hypothetical protein
MQDEQDIDLDHLPELSEKEKTALDGLGPDFMKKLLAKELLADG